MKGCRLSGATSSHAHGAGHPRLAVVWGLMVGLLAGCPGRPVSQPPAGEADQPVRPAVTLRLVDRAEYESILKELRGKVVLVDFWATWCIPCVQAFPHTVEWAEKYADQGLVCVSVSFDDPDERGGNAQALAFLERQGAEKLVNLLSRFGADAQSFEAFEISGGGIPHYKLYDRRGELIGSFGNDDPDHPLNPEEIEAAIVEALKGSAGA
ncbi:MAG: redoxin family protein [Planctomycetes bacterium]|nr:redoxin family protein [Planctomycetota bacterium]